VKSKDAKKVITVRTSTFQATPAGDAAAPVENAASAAETDERERSREALKAAAGRVAGSGGAAERLGLKRTTLQNKIRRLGIAEAHYRQKPCLIFSIASPGNETRGD